MILFVCFFTVVSGCSSIPTTGTYTCEEIEPWIKNVEKLGKQDKGYPPIEYFSIKNTIIWVSPAFHDEVFQVTFGSPYSKLSADELKGIRYSFYNCYNNNDPWIRGTLASAFYPEDGKGFVDRDYPLWKSYITKINTVSYAKMIEIRSKDMSNSTVWTPEKDAIATRWQKSENKRNAEIRAKKNDEKWSNFGKLLGAVYAIGQIEKLGNREREMKTYSSYGTCAPKLVHRLITCEFNLGLSECTSLGCNYAAQCNKGSKGQSCEYTTGYASNTGKYYCDSNNSQIYFEDIDEVIRKICYGEN